MNGSPPPAPVDAAEIARLEEMARRIRVAVIRTVHAARVGHVGGPSRPRTSWSPSTSGSCASAPRSPTGPTATASSSPRATPPSACTRRWRCAATSRSRSWPPSTRIDSRLQGHPDMALPPGVDMSIGLPGHGLLRRPGHRPRRAGRGQGLHHLRPARRRRVQGGAASGRRPTWPRATRLDNLVAIIDHNKLQQFGWRGDVRRRPAAARTPAPSSSTAGRPSAGSVLEMDGHDMAEVLATLEPRRDHRGRPGGHRRPHHQGQGGLVHGGQLRVAHPGAQRRGARQAHGRARRADTVAAQGGAA